MKRKSLGSYGELSTRKPYSTQRVTARRKAPWHHRTVEVPRWAVIAFAVYCIGVTVLTIFG